MRKLLKYTVATAMEMKLIDLAVQAVDGTKIPANAARDRNYNATELQRLLERAEVAIADMENQNEFGEDAPPPRLPEELQQAQTLRHQIRKAMDHLEQNPKLKRVNLTDEDAQLMQGRDRIITGYNAQTMVSPLAMDTAKRTGMLITATKVVNTAADYGQLETMLEQAEDLTGEWVPITLADGGCLFTVSTPRLPQGWPRLAQIHVCDCTCIFFARTRPFRLIHVSRRLHRSYPHLAAKPLFPRPAAIAGKSLLSPFSSTGPTGLADPAGLRAW